MGAGDRIQLSSNEAATHEVDSDFMPAPDRTTSVNTVEEKETDPAAFGLETFDAWEEETLAQNDTAPSRDEEENSYGELPETKPPNQGARPPPPKSKVRGR